MRFRKNLYYVVFLRKCQGLLIIKHFNVSCLSECALCSIFIRKSGLLREVFILLSESEVETSDCFRV